MPINLICERCGKPFTRPPSMSYQRFCSRACWYAVLPSVHAAKREKRTCKNCGKEYEYVKSRNGKEFCSPECRYKYWQGENHPNYIEGSNIEVSCDMCGKVVIRPRSWTRAYKNTYCSKRCQWDSNKERCGENSANWQGGHISYYGPNWRSQQRKARKRDGYTCQRCGITKEEYHRALDVHHIKPFREFGVERYKEANELSNLISYCQSCHQTVEHSGST